MKSARVLSFNARTGEFNIIIAKELEDYYKALECECFDVTSRDVGGKRYDIFVDDIGLFRDNPIPSAINSEMGVVLVGNLVFTKTNSIGETISLTDEDIAHIYSCKTSFINADTLQTHEIIFPVDA